MTEQVVQINYSNHMATICLNRAASLNSYDLAMSQALLDATEEVESNPDIKLVCIRGEGQAFMSGGDIQFFRDKLDTMPQGVKSIIRTLAGTVQNIRQSNKVYLACVHGAVAGAGLSIMMACDMVVAQHSTVFTTAYALLGTSPDGGLSYLLTQAIGTKKAMELLLTAEKFSAQQALSLGLINHAYKDEEYSDKVEQLVQKLCHSPSNITGSVKQLVYASTAADFSHQLELEAEHFIQATTTENFREGVHAFLEKRRPKFS